MVKILGILIVTSVWISSSSAMAKKTIINSISPKHIKYLKSIDKKYQKKHGINIKLDKTVISEIMGTTKKSKGEFWLDKGKMRLVIEEPQPQKIIADGDYIWIVNPPLKEFKESKTQVMKASLKSPQAKRQGLVQILTKGGFLKYFKVVGVKEKAPKISYFLQPKKQATEFKRAQLVVDRKSGQFTELKIWDAIDNETAYKFNSTKFNLTLGSSLFRYSPPKDAEITVI